MTKARSARQHARDNGWLGYTTIVKVPVQRPG
jgi:hypothetical protein